MDRCSSLLITPTITCARDWATTVAQVEQSVVRLTYPYHEVNPHTGKEEKGEYICTGFSIDDVHSYFETAYHCLNSGTAEGLTADGHATRVMYANRALDIAVLQVPNYHLPVLQPSKKLLRKGDLIATLGHGYGMSDTLFRAGYVAHPSIDMGDFGKGHWLIFDGPYIGGMSGGPVFSIDGRVVGLVQQSDEYSGFGVTIDTMLKVTSIYWKG